MLISLHPPIWASSATRLLWPPEASIEPQQDPTYPLDRKEVVCEWHRKPRPIRRSQSAPFPSPAIEDSHLGFVETLQRRLLTSRLIARVRLQKVGVQKSAEGDREIIDVLDTLRLPEGNDEDGADDGQDRNRGEKNVNMMPHNDLGPQARQASNAEEGHVWQHLRGRTHTRWKRDDLKKESNRVKITRGLEDCYPSKLHVKGLHHPAQPRYSASFQRRHSTHSTHGKMSVSMEHWVFPS